MAAPVSDGLSNGQARIIGFLSADVDLAFSLLDTAKIAREAGNTVHTEALVLVIRQTIETIRRVNGSIKGISAWNEIHHRANSLEDALNSFQKSDGAPGTQL